MKLPAHTSIITLCSLALTLTGCLGGSEESADPAVDTVETTVEASASLTTFERRALTGDIVEYSLIVPVGPGPSDRIRVHRVVRESAPYRPRSTHRAVMMLHGDFSTFDTNFVLASLPDAASPGPSLAVWLAAHDIDVWGMDRRWTLLPLDTTDFSSLHGQGIALAAEDVERALTLARGIRALGGDGSDRLTLLGFSSGALLSYVVASAETQRPPALRNVRALVPLDVYYHLGPDGEEARQAACARSQGDQAALEAGYDQSDNTILSFLAEQSRDAPADPSPVFDGMSNRDALLTVLTQTYWVFDATQWYHLGGGTFTGDTPTGLRYSPLDRMTDWFQRATPYQALAESADDDAIWCGEAPLPVADHLADIHIPVYAVGAAGGFGELGRYTTTQLGSNDVTFTLVRRLGVGDEVGDYGHGDLLYAPDAPNLVWKPLKSWILSH